ncbi:peptide ABC transporter substrate-binding protein [Paludibacterium purpuratum]|uniref:Oligopeptide transport system substrate-binding protein n=1 Tax=Paludibacterium purpuratum TaxID=1144873 RepID=A0A4R7B6S3_9NEIS|nr:peptide ABC transporter substrate-binding protein [Paludibacterium purpuratum]TDR80410.1 oligopeptide transport system substrate-binding protein [Paludibacterium purpuratum]
MKQQNVLSVIAASVALALAVPGAALAAKVPAGVKLAATQELVRSNGSEPESLDPMVVEGVPANIITHDLFEGLTSTDNEGKLHPGVAESWKQTSPTTWVFHLRKNAKWSDGSSITADDFVYGIRRLVDPKLAAPYAGTFGIFFANGQDIVDGKKPLTAMGVKALDKSTLEVTTAFPVSYLPELMSNAQLGPAPKAVIDKYGKDWTKPGKMVSNGPFVLKEWQVNSKVVIAKNAQYWDAKNVQLTKVSFLPIEDQTADVKLYQSGQTDMTYEIPPGTFAKLKSDMPKDLKTSTILGLRYYSLNNKLPMFKDVRVRKALSMVIDRDLMAQKITADGQLPSYSVIVKGVNGAKPTTYDWATWPMAKRVAEAKKLLAAAGVKPGTTLNLSYNTSDYHKKMAIFVASEWKTKLGLNTSMDNSEFKVFLKKRHDGDYQVARNGWLADYNDATSFLALVQCGNTQNDNFNCNKKAEDLIEQGNMSTDPVKRTQLLTQATKMIMDDYPLIPVLQYTLPRLVKPYVGGYSLKNPVDRYRSKELYIIQH